MKSDINEITINGVAYVQKGTEVTQMASSDGKECVLIRSEKAGVHFGYLAAKTGNEVSLINSRRIWYWDGAASLSQMAMEGVKKPSTCKFSVVVPSIVVLGVCEILSVTSVAEKNINGVPVWKR
jgi:hypothetical protein